MKETSKEAGNKAIAEFMGVKIGVDKYSWRIGVTEPLQEKHLAYHEQWGWLMPVVERIETLDEGNFSVFIVGNECDIAFSTKENPKGEDYHAPNFRTSADTKIEATWQSVVKFINWYNTQK